MKTIKSQGGQVTDILSLGIGNRPSGHCNATLCTYRSENQLGSDGGRNQDCGGEGIVRNEYA